MGQRNEDAKKQLEAMLKKLRQQGWDVEQGRRGWKATPPHNPRTGRRPGGPVFCHMTPSDYRSIKNIRSLFRQRGADL